MERSVGPVFFTSLNLQKRPFGVKISFDASVQDSILYPLEKLK
jgi:hypothetical protein